LSTLKHCLKISKHPWFSEELQKELLAEQAAFIQEGGNKSPVISGQAILNKRIKELSNARGYVSATIMAHQIDLQKAAKAEGKPVWKPKTAAEMLADLEKADKKPLDVEKPQVSEKTRQASALADWLATTLNIKMSEKALKLPITWQELFKKANQFFKGTQAQGVYTPRDAYDAMELGVNRYLLRHFSWIMPNAQRKSPSMVIDELKDLVDLLPTQSKRTKEQEDFQQYSTPPFLGYVANWVANIGSNDVYLEPSAGIGGLAVFGRMSNAAQIYVNELSKRRAELLSTLGLGELFTEDAEQLDNILPDHVKPTVVVMNPPFSATAGRLVKNMTKFGAQHVESALRRLENGGRLVAIVGRGMEMNSPTFRKWWTGIRKKYNVRANIGIDGGEYRKFGTTFDNRLLIIDKTGPTVIQPLESKVDSVNKLPGLLRKIRNDRQEAPELSQKGEPEPIQPPLPEAPEAGEGPPSGAPTTRPEPPGLEPGEQTPETGDRGPGGPSQQPTEPPTGPRGELPEPGEPTEAGPTPGPGGGIVPGTPQRGERESEQLPPESGELSLDEFDDLLDEVESEQPPKTAPTAPTTAPMGETPTTPTAKKGEKSGYEEIGDLFKEPQAPYEVREDQEGYGLLEPEKYEKARPLLEKEYRRFMQGAKNFRDQAKKWIKEAYKQLTSFGVPFEIAKNWVRNFYASDRPSLKPTRPPGQVDVEAAKREVTELEEKLYQRYTPTVRIKGAKKHPTQLDESAALGDTTPPPVTYRPKLPQEMIDKGLASDAQLEAVTYAGQAHDQVLPNGERKGFFAGHGTGVGKGRIIASIILDNWNQGRKKAIWISEKAKLFDDAKRDLGYDKSRKTESGIEWGEGADAIFKLKARLGERVKNREGILFTTYSTLASRFKTINEREASTLEDLRIRVNQIVDWAGKDYDGVIAFDESHNMANATVTEGDRGRKNPAAQALAGIMLQRRLPKARVVYVSATGATEVRNLAYAARLGLWGEGTAFGTKRSFINGISAAGLSAMELVARDLKSQGLYLAPTLSYDGVYYDKIVHPLDETQQAKYDELARAWQVVLHNIHAALGETGQYQDANVTRALWSQFWGGQQRFFNQVITTMQMGSGIKHIDEQLAQGKAAVLQLVNHGGSQLERALAAKEKDQELEDLELGPKANLMEYIENAFPIQQYENYIDEEGNEAIRPMFDSQGKPVINREALRMKEEMLTRIGSIQIPGSPLDMILHHFGTDRVAEVTGRKSRIVLDPESGDMTEERWSDAKALKDMEAFMDDKKPILVFSEKGGTGASYHADLDRDNQRPRVHYLVQPGWRADKAIQGLGRTHRSNQAQPPEYFLLTTNLEGQKRFISSIARRLDQLGALTKGQRQTGSQGIFQARDNLESRYAYAALMQLYDDIVNQRSTVTLQEFENQTALRLTDHEGNKLADLPMPTKFMNRLLTMTIEMQNKIFKEWADRIDTIIDAAAAAGTLDIGIETITGLNINKADDRIVNTDENTGANTRYIRLEVTTPSSRKSFEDLTNVDKFFVNNKSGMIWAASPARTRTEASGNVVGYRTLTSPAGSSQRADIEDLDAETALTLGKSPKWAEITKEKDAADRWNAAYKEASPISTRDVHLMTGALLPIWDRLGGSSTVYRMQTDEGERFLGRVIHQNQIEAVLESLGAGGTERDYTGERLSKEILEHNAKARLVNRWRLKRVTVSGEERIELSGPDFSDWQILEGYGVIIEKINYNTRYFIPTGAKSASTLDSILKFKPVANVSKPYSGPKLSETVLNEPQDINELFGKGTAVQMSLFTPEQEAGKKLPPSRQVVEMQTTGDISHYGTKIRNPQEAAGLLSFLIDKAAEEAYTIAVDENSNVVQIHRISKGSKGSTSVPLIEAGGSLLRAPGAAKVYFVHQHPSRSLQPSVEDISISTLMRNLTAMRDIEFVPMILAGGPERYSVLDLNKLENNPKYSLKPETKKRVKANLNTKLPVSERFIKTVRGWKQEGLPAMKDSKTAKEHLKATYHDMQGFMLMNSKNQDLGFVPWPKDLTVKEFTARLIMEAERHNASGMLANLKSKDGSAKLSRQRVDYFKALVKDLTGHLTLLDVLIDDVSLNDKGVMAAWRNTANWNNQSDFLEPFLSDKILYSKKGKKPETSLTAEQVRNAVDPIVIEMKAKPGVTVLNLQSSLPAPIQEHLRENHGESDIIVAAVHNGRVFLVAENIEDSKEATKALLHEIMGHFGIHSVLGDQANKILTSVYVAKREDMKPIADEYGFNLKTKAGRIDAADEWLAREAEMNPESRWIDRVVAAIRKWIRKIKPGLKFTDAEIRALLANARQYIRTGQKVSTFPPTDIVTEPKYAIKKQGSIDVINRLPEHVKHRFAQHRGVPKVSWIEKAREKIQFVRSQRYHFPDLYTIGNQREEDQLNDVLRQHQEVPETAKDFAARKILEFTRDLSQDEYEVFRIHVILSDMMRDINGPNPLLTDAMLKEGETLPFGFKNVQEIRDTYDTFEQLADQAPKVRNAITERRRLINGMVRQMVKFKILKKEVLKHKDYFHHQVLSYWAGNHMKTTGTSSADVRTHWRPWMAARKGSLLDYNTEYVEAEFAALAQQFAQLETAKTLEKVKNISDIHRDLKTSAKAENLRNFYIQAAKQLSAMFKTKITPQEVREDHELDPLFGYRQNIAMASAQLEQMAFKDKLEVDSEWDDVLDFLAESHELRKMGEEEAAAIPPPHISDARFFGFLSYLIEKKKPGSSWAATIFKAIQGRNKHIKNSLGDQFVTYRQLIPEGYTEWKPDPGKGWFWSNTIADDILQKIIAGEKALEDKDVRQALAKGRDLIWVIPQGLASTMDNFRRYPEPNSLGRMADWALAAWKQWILINPRRWIRYNLNNMSGDLDITFAYAPAIIKGMKQAFADLRKWQARKELDPALQAELDMWRRKGVLGSGFAVQEVEDVLNIMSMDKWVREILLGEKPNLAMKYWSKAKNYTVLRENVLRLAAARYFRQKLKDGQRLHGASKPHEVENITNLDDKAAKLGRELIGDYGNLSSAGQYIRRRLIPFYSWMEINLPRYVYLMRNLRTEDRHSDAAKLRMKMAGIVSKKVAIGAGKLMIKANLLMGAVLLYNLLAHKDEWEELGEAKRRQMHLILGRREDGTIQTIRFQGALSDALAFFGLEDWPADISDVVKGKASIQEKLIEAPEAFATKVISGIRPEPKLLFEGLTKEQLYPDPFRPRPVRDTLEHVLRAFSLDSIYRMAAGKPGRGATMANHFLSDIKSLLVYTSDPGEQAYYDTRKMVFDWLEDTGVERPSGKPTKRSNALYYYRQALKYGDLQAAKRYLEKYYQMGGTSRTLRSSIKRAHPLASVPVRKRYNFRQSLSPAQSERLKMALKWYERMYKKQDLELRQGVARKMFAPQNP
jgi:DNA repair protein RadC